MRCGKARRMFSEHFNNELDLEAQKALRDHLDGCPECRKGFAEYLESMDLLQEVSLPELPEGFEAELHQKIASYSAERSCSADLPDRLMGESGLLRWSERLAFLLCGACAVLLATWILPKGQSREAKRPVLTGKAEAPRPKKVETAIPMDQVVVLNLMLHSKRELKGVHFEVVLPDGVSFVGQGSSPLEEKMMTWKADLKEGENQVLIPVKARRPGRWLLVARAKKKEFQLVSEVVLKVAPGKKTQKAKGSPEVS